jgi:spore coat protein A
MKLTRRDFVKTTAIGAAGIMAYKAGLRSGYAYAVSEPLRKFIQRMPLFGTDIPLAQPFTSQPYAGVDYYQLRAVQYSQQLHPALNETRLYGYADHTNNPKHLGGAILATRGTPVRLQFSSELPDTHILPFDPSIPTLETTATGRQDRAAIHLHGGLVPWPSDGGPFHWQSKDPSVRGSSVTDWLSNGTSDTWDYYYPNLQSARLMWYHDHAVGQTRLNAYAGLATGYILQDDNDKLTNGILNNHPYNIPFLGQPIVFQDKVFWNDVNDPAYGAHVPGAKIGDLWYPWFYDPAIWPVAKGGNPPFTSAVPEFFGDTMLANGMVFPYHVVAAGNHRFRLINACNARWLDLSFVQEDPAIPGEVLVDKKGVPIPASVDVWQIGTEGGFLPQRVQLVAAGVPLQPFLLGPAERADIIVDFKAAGNVILYNVAGSPFPGGAPIFDWYIGNKNLPTVITPGFGPNTRTIMQFRVDVTLTPPIPMTIPSALPGVTIPTVPDLKNGGLLVDQAALAAQFPGFAYDQVPVDVSLNEVVEPATFNTLQQNTGRLLTLIGSTADPTLLPFGSYGTYYFEKPTEIVTYNTVRIWRIFNFTADAHPMHFHLFNVQILARQNANKNFRVTGKAVMPLPNEMGLKETVTVYPGQVTIVAALIEDPLPEKDPLNPNGPIIYPRDNNKRPQVPVTVGGATTYSTVPFSRRLAAAPYNMQADEYVWHCHILEHEEHDMMRPLVAS